MFKGFGFSAKLSEFDLLNDYVSGQIIFISISLFVSISSLIKWEQQ